MKIDRKSLLIGILIGIIIGAISSIILLTNSDSLIGQPATRLKVTANQWASITIDGIRYDFYYPLDSDYVELSDGESQVGTLYLAIGRKMENRGIEITVSDIHSDYIILLLKAL